VPAFAGNQVFRVRRDGPVAFLKLADGPDLRREVAVLEVLGPLGVPVPFIEAADPSGDLAGVACVLLREVASEPSDCSSPEFTQAGQALRQVHGVILEGHGRLTASPGGLHGEHRSWAGAIAERTGDLGRIAENGLVDAGLLDQAAAAVRDRRGLVAGAESGHLLHGDFSPRRVFARTGASQESSTGATRSAVTRSTTSGASCTPRSSREMATSATASPPWTGCSAHTATPRGCSGTSPSRCSSTPSRSSCGQCKANSPTALHGPLAAKPGRSPLRNR
jgi:hypothetical protein